MLGPSVDASGDVGDSGITIGPEELGNPQAAGTNVAKDQNNTFLGYVPEVFWNLPHGDVLAVGESAEGHLIGLPDIK